ncbi:MAG: 30S ribosomal protein S17 [Candidatus Levybacteria bacterium]|nr:30S ribosomal protein S17 [Candidatus Levybacteria bacterium]MBP9814865.1 30S ribosomal protein S17 [Candidatus Levybacteria bacterium]
MSKKTFTGKVVSDKMKNTIIVAIERNISHPRYGKLIKRTQKLMADKSGMDVVVGDIVKIEETKPMSKNKNFKVVKKEDGSKATK